MESQSPETEGTPKQRHLESGEQLISMTNL
jgi:hypothetical protein